MTDGERAERMVDFSLEEVNITFDLGAIPPSEEDIEQVQAWLDSDETEMVIGE